MRSTNPLQGFLSSSIAPLPEFIPVKKKVALTLKASRISSTSLVNLLGPSSNVNATVFGTLHL